MKKKEENPEDCAVKRLNAREVYQLIVGEGGCSPDYFFNRMGVPEARDYIVGLNRRYRQDWERTRMLSQVFHKVQTGKDLDIEFPWEIEDKPEVTEEEIEALRKKAKVMENLMNKGNGKSNSLAGEV